MAEKKIQRFETNISNFGEVNNGFIRATVNILTKDQKANGFLFDESGIEKRRRNWDYIPVKAEYMEENKDLGSHGGKLIIDDNGMEFIQTTKPMGVVIANTDRYEDITTMNGETERYFAVDVYLWYDQFKKELDMFRNGENRSQSMEVEILESSYDYATNTEHVYDFKPLALCMLGNNCPPAFVNSKVKVQFESDEFKAQYNTMLSALDKVIKMQEEISKEGGVDVEDNKTEQLEDVVEPVTEPEVEQPVNEEPSVEINEEVEIAEPETEDIPEQVDYQVLHTELQTAFNDLKEKYDDLTTQYNLLNDEVGGLREFKSNIEAQEQQAQLEMERRDKQAMIDSFTALTVEEKAKVIDNIDNFTVEEIESKLSVAFARKIKITKVDDVEETKTFANIETKTQPSHIEMLIATVEQAKKNKR